MPKNGGVNDLSLVGLVRKFVDPDGPLAQLYYDTADVLLESHKKFAESYQRFLEEHQDEYDEASPEEQEKLLVKALMTAYLDVLKSRPERERYLVDLHKKTIDVYLGFVGDLMREMKQAKDEARRFWSIGAARESRAK